MRVLLVSTYDVSGGAARASDRLRRGLLGVGLDCRALVRNKAARDERVCAVAAAEQASKSEQGFMFELIQDQYLNRNRTELSNTFFSLSYPGWDISRLPLVQAADVINLHWVADFQSPPTLKRLFEVGKPVVWTLHDQWAFTGGCHYSAGCEGYRSSCTGCPQLREDPYDLPAAILGDKLDAFRNGKLTIVTPSHWMAECARNSGAFRDVPVRVIPNGLETDIFQPASKARAKTELGLAEDRKTVLFGAEYGSEKRKGFHELAEALRFCLSRPGFQQLASSGRLTVLVFGRPHRGLEDLGVPVQALGYLHSDEAIRTAYAAADVFVQASLEDNFPNTMLEAMSCGTPVVAFRVGGMPDVIVDGEEGRLVKAGDAKGLGEAILSLIGDPETLARMGRRARAKIEEQYTLEIQARQYAALFDEVLEGKPETGAAEGEGSEGKAWSRPPGEGEGPVEVAPMEFRLGSRFERIHERVLLKTLGGYAVRSDKAFRSLEAEKKSWLEQIETLTRNLGSTERHDLDLERQLKTVTQQLCQSEEDRRTLLDQLQRISGFLKEANDDREERLRQIVRLTEQLRQAGEYQERLHGDVSLLLEQRKALEEALVKLSAVLSSPLVRFLQAVHLIRGAPDSWQPLVESCKEKQ